MTQHPLAKENSTRKGKLKMNASVVLRGANVAFYKFALAKSILALAQSGATSASLEDLAVPSATS